MPFSQASSALARFTVLDLTQVRAGPTAVRELADWGANVIKIEPPAHLVAGEPLGGPRESSDFQNLHRNKRSLALDLKAPEGIAAFRRMAAKADVVVENFRPDVKERLGIDYPALRRINPRLVYASISGFGQTGPYRDRPGFDQIAQGMGGLMSITGKPGDGPMRVGIPIADLSALAGNAPLTMHATKFIVGEIRKDPSARDLARCDALVAECFASRDYVEGRTAFMEKRKPRFTGR